MEYIIHWTSHSKWQEIQKHGMLLPKTEPFPPDNYVDISDRVRKIATSESYLVGIPEQSIDGYINCGLGERLMELTSPDVRLRVPILKSDGVFVRELVHLSPQHLRKLYGDDFIEELKRNFVFSSVRDSRLRNAFSQYIESAIELKKYKGQFEVPEIWLPQETLINLIEAELNPTPLVRF